MVLKIEEFDFNIKHRLEKLNKIADWPCSNLITAVINTVKNTCESALANNGNSNDNIILTDMENEKHKQKILAAYWFEACCSL